MKDQIIVITGANSGIGFATAIELTKQGAEVILVCRDEARGNEALKKVQSTANGQSPKLFVADLASQAAVRDLSTKLHEHLPRIDILINNAAAAFPDRKMTVDGIERTFAINYLAPFLLTHLVLDLIRKSPAGRIVNVTAGMPGLTAGTAWFPGAPKTDFLENLQGERHYSQVSAYKLSKFGIMLFTYELARRLKATGITVNCLHPGVIATPFGRKAGGTISFVSKVLTPFLRGPEVGAQTPVYLATSPEVGKITGGYFEKSKQKKSAPITYDPEIALKYWNISERLTGLDSKTGAK
jgi:NAD(P)-dependent dehydrogenase (short-subunit alcohol dehydrogenase family)